MGAATFECTARGDDAESAFRAGVAQARNDHGTGGYSGTIAEKNTWELITDKVMTLAEARTLAYHLIACGTRDGRIDDKHGPAGAIQVHASLPHRAASGRCVPGGWYFFGWASD